MTERSKAHAKHVYHCSCGKRPVGNGGRSSHATMHERRGDDAREVTATHFRELFGCAECQGLGFVLLDYTTDVRKPCPVCRGRGWIVPPQTNRSG